MIWSAIITAIAGIIGLIVSHGENSMTNAMNAGLARENREDAQAYNTQAANVANQRTINNYNQLYSPAAQVNQLKAAGLNPSLFYGKGGTGGTGQAAAMAAPANMPAPIMQPTIKGDWMTDIISSLNETIKTKTDREKTESDIEVNQATVDKIYKDIEETDATIKKIEEETRTEVVSRELKEQEKRLKEQEVKFQQATFEDRVKMVSEMLRTQEETTNKIMREIDLLDIEKKYAEQLKKATLRNLNAQTAKLEAEKALVVAQEATERMRKILTLNEAVLTAQQCREVKQQVAVLESEERKLKDEISRERWKDKQYYRNRPSGSTPWAIISDAVKQFEANLKDWHIEYEE